MSTNWKATHAEVRASIGIGQTEQPWAARPGTRGTPDISRQHDLINIAFGDARRKNASLPVASVAANLFVDVNPSAHFKPWGGLKGLTTGSCFYSFEMKRLLSVLEHFYLLGFDLSKLNLATLCRSDVADLTGNANSLQQVSAVFYALVLTADLPGIWERDSETAESSVA